MNPALKPERPHEPTPRRRFLGHLGAGLAAGLCAGSLLGGWLRSRRTDTVWQIDPEKCTACGECALLCVKALSAVKAFHHFPICGYCDLCTGYFLPDPYALDTGAENLQCPTGALVRRFVEEPFFEYTVDHERCNGCGRCARGCMLYGNGSLYLQIDHQACLHCHECRIARECPAGALVRVPIERPYLRRRSFGEEP